MQDNEAASTINMDKIKDDDTTFRTAENSVDDEALYHDHRSRLKDIFGFLLENISTMGIIASAITFCFTQSYQFWETRIRTSHLKVLNFEYPGDFVFTNVGGADIVVDSAIFTWPEGPVHRNSLVIPINRVVKPSDVTVFTSVSQYKEPDAIGIAEWEHGKLDLNTVRDAFAISNNKRCSVFHVNNIENSSFKIMDDEKAGPLMKLPATAIITVLHPSNIFGPAQDQVSRDAQTVFLRIPNCTNGK